MTNIKSSFDIQQAYKEYVGQKRFAELANLIKSSQTKPAEYIVRMGFKSFMEEDQGNRVKLFAIMKLKEITGVKPDQNIMRLTCEIALEMDSPEVIEALINRIQIDKSVFQDMGAVLQKIYDRYVQEGRFVDISRLMELTDTQASDDIIHKGYEHYLSEGKFISFAGLKKRTGVPPQETLIQDAFREYYANYLKFKRISQERAEVWLERIKKLKRLAKVEPEGFKIDDLEDKSAASHAEKEEE